MTWINRTLHRTRGQGGYTLTEMAVALGVFSVIAGAAFLVMTGSTKAKQAGDNITEAQQNARAAMNAIVRDLRSAGYGVDPDQALPIEVASDFRMTLVVDSDRDGSVDPGERITYFLDPSTSSSAAARTENPYDHVLRRVVSTSTDSLATPATGKGEIVAYLVTQRSSLTANALDTPLFRYLAGDGSILSGQGYDPDDASLGYTLPDSALGAPAGSGLPSQVSRIQVEVVTETASESSSNGTFRRYALSSTIRPRNFALDDLLAGFEVIDNSGAPGDSSGGGAPGDSSTAPPDTTEEEILPPYEPPIHISTARVLSMAMADLGEVDSEEGSDTDDDDQGDSDIVLGTKAGSTNNLSVWFNGQPGLYDGLRLFDAVPNYYGNSSFDIQDIALTPLSALSGGYKDAAVAVKLSDTQGGFQVWLNQDANPGWLGSGYPTSAPSLYFSNGTGAGQAIAVADVDGDGDDDVLLGTRTGNQAGRVDLWLNDGYGGFIEKSSFNPGGEVTDLVVLDYDYDGLLDFACSIVTNKQGTQGRIVVFHNSGNPSSQFMQTYSYPTDAVNALAVANLNGDGWTDLVAGTKSNPTKGGVQFWKGTGDGWTLADQVSADGPVLSLAVGPISYPDPDWDVVAGTEARSVQCWFSDPSNGDDVLPPAESWADANAGGDVHAVSIAKLEQGSSGGDPLYDIVAGTAVSSTQGEIVIYLNPYVWTLQQP